LVGAVGGVVSGRGLLVLTLITLFADSLFEASIALILKE